ncbi:MAG: alpha/beta fold hydrolase [Planctomycetota bacterium]|nr:alpha/beta fold hydrolase [Planctomycetota bacterium]
MRLALRLTTALLLLATPAGVWAREPAAAPTFWNGRDQAKEVAAWTLEYFDADAERRAEIRAALDELGYLKPTDVKKHAKSIFKKAKKRGPKLDKKSKTFTHGKLTGKLHMQGRGRKGGVLVIALHGGGQGVGDGANALSKWGSVFGKALVIAPTAPELRATAWNQPDIEAWVLALIDAAKRSFDIDTNRIYLVGHSMGGFGTWSVGCRHADRFAGLSPCAGGVFVMRSSAGVQVGPGWVTNLLNTPIRFFHSTDDKQVGPAADQAAARALEALEAEGYDYDWVYDEYDDIGHGLPKKGLKPIAEWLLERKRNPHPKHVLFEPMRQPRLPKDRLFWLGHTGQGRVEGKIEGQQVKVTTKAYAKGVTVYLAPELVDLKKPVQIELNGKERHNGVVHARLSVLLHTIVTAEDPKQWYAHAVEIE